MIELNYYGGEYYNDGNYLFQYPKESDASYKVRKSRAVLFNQLAPIVDLLVGFIFANQPQRVNIEKVEYIIENASKGATINNFMRSVAKWSLMFTCGVLVDSPDFDAATVVTEQDRENAGLNPYALLYKPERIRDFSVNDRGELTWVLLDNSHLDNTNPLEPDMDVVEYRLWTADSWTDFIIDGGKVEPGLSGNHTVGYVPFKFVNWRDDNIDFIAESICEDLAMINRAIYNLTSYADEMLAAGTFKMLAYPSMDGTVPEGLEQGISPLGILPYPQEGDTPTFIGAELQEMDSFIKAMEMFMTELLKKVGMDNDEEKAYVKSGAARKLDFEKVKTILTGGASELQKLELWIYQTAQAWKGEDSDIEVTYTKDFLNEDVDEKLARFSQMALLPYDTLTKELHKLMAAVALSNDIQPEIMDKITKEIDEAEVEPVIDIDDDEEDADE